MVAAALQWSSNGIYRLVLKSKMSVNIWHDLQEGHHIKVFYAATVYICRVAILKKYKMASKMATKSDRIPRWLSMKVILYCDWLNEGFSFVYC